MKRLERMALTAFVVVGCVSIIGAFIEVDGAQAANSAPPARGTAPAYGAPAPPQPSPPTPNFNSSSPNTVPQSNEIPVSPEAPGTSPGTH
jgi:hypothetical protein